MTLIYQTLKLLLIAFLLVGPASISRADHIMGGYLGMKQLDPQTGRFRITLRLYLDMNGVTYGNEPLLLTSGQDVKIFRRRDNQEMAWYIMPDGRFKPLIYDNTTCAEQLKLNARQYEFPMEVVLPPQDYDDPQGYYLVWERCCRNQVLSNIVDPANSSIVLINDFPALWQNGAPVRYSSPEFANLNGDYICVNKNFTYNFSATDPDGDELRYRLVTPLKGSMGKYELDLAPRPAPYPAVNWASGHSLTAVIPGQPPLGIDARTGQLTLRASRTGWFAFAILCEKYRKGQKIGEVRHEFTLPVVDCGLTAPPAPVITYQGQPVGDTLWVCAGQAPVLETQAGSNWSLQWQRAGENLVGARANAYQVQTEGAYQVVKSWAQTCGLDTASRPVQVRYSSASSTVRITRNQPMSFCPGSALTLTLEKPVAALFYQWFRDTQLAGTGPELTVRQAGVYRVEVQGSECVAGVDSVAVREYAVPALPGGQDQHLCAGERVVLLSQEQSGWQYHWQVGGQEVGTTARLVVTQPGEYQVKVHTAEGCEVVSSPYTVHYRLDCVQGPESIFVPDAFTPNGDGSNDRWEVRPERIAGDCRVWIYNRWGEVIYESTDLRGGWDGTHGGHRVEPGAYTYRLEIESLSWTRSGKVMVLY